ncbi:hypothetical protein AC578_1112 [Pseudocercospora eumusae]|uniref:Rhodopsin domain-containing protein n=1 Tax=Pseudocercospora eumusae TaxID=321146 RepID=A0A139HTZ4_9PEZI|nr:hypothetical protein AC578_1112 [Pseudocercospora eumusae]
MALARSNGSPDFEDWSAEKIVITPVPVVRHPETFTKARAGLVAVGVLFTILGTFAIVCRILTLIQRRRKIGHDDHAMFIAYTCSVAFTIATFISVRWGVGLELRDVPLFWAERAIQLSLMCLYLRLGNELRGWFWHASLALLAVIVLHFITTVIVFSVQCIPMKKYWRPSTPGKCIDITAFFYSANIFTIITDLVMIALPMPIIWKIPRPKGQKVGIMAAFLVAGLGTLASCIRMYSIKIYTDSRQPMRDAAPISTWSFIEINLGILCASVAGKHDLMKAFQVVMLTRQTSVIKPVFTKTVAPSLVHEHQQRTPKRFSSTVYTTPLSSVPSSRTNRKSQHTLSAELEKMNGWSSSHSPTTPEKSPARDVEAGLDSNGSPVRYSSRLPEPPRVHQSNTKGITTRPEKADHHMLKAYVTKEPSDGSSLLTISRQQQAAAASSERLPLYSHRPDAPRPIHSSNGQPVAGW